MKIISGSNLINLLIVKRVYKLAILVITYFKSIIHWKDQKFVYKFFEHSLIPDQHSVDIENVTNFHNRICDFCGNEKSKVSTCHHKKNKLISVAWEVPENFFLTYFNINLLFTGKIKNLFKNFLSIIWYPTITVLTLKT